MKLKKLLASLITAATLLSSMCLGTNATEVTKYGIKYDDSVYNARFSVVRDLVTKHSEKGIPLGIMTYRIGHLKNKTNVARNTYEHMLVVKMIMQPQKNYASDVYGVSEYLKCSMSLPSNDVNYWQPTNNPPTDNWTFSLGGEYSKGSGISGNVSVSTTVEKERLDVEADVRPSSKKAIFNFDYKPYKSIFSFSKTKNKYFRNSSTQYCMISVNSDIDHFLYFDFTANFTWSDEQYAKPFFVRGGSYTATHTGYEFPLSNLRH